MLKRALATFVVVLLAFGVMPTPGCGRGQGQRDHARQEQ